MTEAAHSNSSNGASASTSGEAKLITYDKKVEIIIDLIKFSRSTDGTVAGLKKRIAQSKPLITNTKKYGNGVVFEPFVLKAALDIWQQGKENAVAISKSAINIPCNGEHTSSSHKAFAPPARVDESISVPVSKPVSKRPLDSEKSNVLTPKRQPPVDVEQPSLSAITRSADPKHTSTSGISQTKAQNIPSSGWATKLKQTTKSHIQVSNQSNARLGCDKDAQKPPVRVTPTAANVIRETSEQSLSKRRRVEVMEPQHVEEIASRSSHCTSKEPMQEMNKSQSVSATVEEARRIAQGCSMLSNLRRLEALNQKQEIKTGQSSWFRTASEEGKRRQNLPFESLPIPQSLKPKQEINKDQSGSGTAIEEAKRREALLKPKQEINKDQSGSGTAIEEAKRIEALKPKQEINKGQSSSGSAVEEAKRIEALKPQHFPSQAAWGFAVLGLRNLSNPDLTAVQRAYRTMMSKFHPDKPGHLPHFPNIMEQVRQAKQQCERKLSMQQAPGAPTHLRCTVLCATEGKRQFRLEWNAPASSSNAPVKKYIVAAFDPAYGRALSIAHLEPDYSEEQHRFISIEEICSYVVAEEDLQKMPQLFKQEQAHLQVSAANQTGQSQPAKISVSTVPHIRASAMGMPYYRPALKRSNVY